jgi:hypothetical protein
MNSVQKYVETHFNRFVEEFMGLCWIPSISAQKKGLDVCAEALVAHLKAIGALNEAEGGVRLNLRILLDPQEEIGSPMLEKFVTENVELFRADFGYNADGPPLRGTFNLPQYIETGTWGDSRNAPAEQGDVYYRILSEKLAAKIESHWEI